MSFQFNFDCLAQLIARYFTIIFVLKSGEGLIVMIIGGPEVHFEFKPIINSYKSNSKQQSSKIFFLLLFTIMLWLLSSNFQPAFKLLICYNIQMGNTSTSHHTNHSFMHLRLGNIKRTQEANDQFCLVYQIVLDNQKLYQEWNKELQTIKMYDSVEEILFLPTRHHYKQTTYCGTGGFAQLYYEDYLYSLQPEIVNRKRILRPFSEQEIVYLFYSLVKIQAILQTKNRHIGEVKPENILVNEDGYVKIISKYSWPEYPNKIVGSWQKANQRMFPAPQECEERYKRKSYNFQNLHRNQCEVFSIGLTILEAGTLNDCSQIYGFSSEYRFNETKLRELLEIFSQRYSSQLTRLLKQMLCSNPRKRIKAETVYKILKPFQYLILNLQQIAIKLPLTQSIAKMDKEEKISIKKVGESQHSTSEYHTQMQKLQASFQPIQSSNYTKISLGQNTHPPHQSTVYGVPQPNTFSPSLQSGVYHPMKSSNHSPQQPTNYQLVNEHSSFKRPVSPNLNMFQPQQERQKLMHSMPLNPVQYQASLNGNKPHYITQNSMLQGRNVQQSSFIKY